MQRLLGIDTWRGYFFAAYVGISHTWHRAFRHAIHIDIYMRTVSCLAFEPFALPNICISICIGVSFAFIAQVIDCTC